MAQIILDIGSGNTLTDEETAIELVKQVIARDTHEHEVIFKTQLFKSAPPNKPLQHKVFLAAWDYAQSRGYHVTSSVFDKESLDFLLGWDLSAWRLPFIKIACRPDKYWLIGEIPRRIPVYVSHNEPPPDCYKPTKNTVNMKCVPKYPANLTDYRDGWEPEAISDHTVGWQLFNEAYDCWGDDLVFEKHICLERSPDNPDSGPFAVLPEDLEGIL